ncbi:MAG TPA: thiol-disulfide oxidoreductase DCC family protein [Polyangiaceae bacterium]|nr:thiol-disulfide oxidoreductase DCC family protein [Polyangiaceae bacterium]
MVEGTSKTPSGARPASLPTAAADSSIVLFDGVCNVCNSAVNFIIDRDPKARFRFASLQSPQGVALAAAHGVDGSQLSTMVLIDEGKAYTNSTALLRVARKLRAPWPLSYVAMLVPRRLRDAVYRYLVANRYRWFGKSESCRVPTPEIRNRFLSA